MQPIHCRRGTAADELERTVTKLGFKGAMINGLTGGVFHDDERFWPIYERAAALDGDRNCRRRNPTLSRSKSTTRTPR